MLENVNRTFFKEKASIFGRILTSIRANFFKIKNKGKEK